MARQPGNISNQNQCLSREHFVLLCNRLLIFVNRYLARDWKSLCQQSPVQAAFNEQRAANQNCTIGISFGAPRELAFRHAKTGELIYVPQKNGMLFYFGRDAMPALNW